MQLLSGTAGWYKLRLLGFRMWTLLIGDTLLSLHWGLNTCGGERKQRKWSRSVVSDSLRTHGLQPTRLLHPWDFPSKSTGVECHCLLQEIFPTQGSNLGLPDCRQMLYHLSQQGSYVEERALQTFMKRFLFVFLNWNRVALGVVWVSADQQSEPAIGIHIVFGRPFHFVYHRVLSREKGKVVGWTGRQGQTYAHHWYRV